MYCVIAGMLLCLPIGYGPMKLKYWTLEIVEKSCSGFYALQEALIKFKN